MSQDVKNEEERNENVENEETQEAAPEGASEQTPESESADQQLSQLKDLLLRKAAEFENFKRRTDTEYATRVRLANESLILSILPVIDDLERSLKSARSASEADPFFKGVELILQKMTRILEAQGVTPFETVGKPFDVHLHDAMMQVPKDDVPHHTILQEVERGYTMNGKVIRHARVVVSTSVNEPPGAGPGASGTPSDDTQGVS